MLEYRDAEEVMQILRGAQIEDGRIQPDGIYLHLTNNRVLVIIGLPSLGVALVQGERSLH